MSDLFQIFNDSSKIAILRVLLFSKTPVPLREISYRSNLSLKVIQNCVTDFQKAGIVTKTAKENRVLIQFQKNKYKEQQSLIKEFLIKLNQTKLCEENKQLSKKTKDILRRIDDLLGFINKAKESRLTSVGYFGATPKASYTIIKDSN